MLNKELIIYFHDNEADKISWIIRENGIITHQPQSSSLADLPTTNLNLDVVVYVPTENIIMLSVILPVMPAAQRAQAALYALEEQLVEDVQNLHAVVWEQHQDHLYGVAIIQKTLLQNWLDKLRAVNIVPTKMFADVITIPAEENEWAVVSHNELIYVKIDKNMGFAIESDYVQTILQEMITNQKILPQQIRVYDKHDKILSLLFNDFNVPVITVLENEKLDSRYFWVNFNYNLVNCNLLQGEMLPQESLYEKYNYLRMPLILSSILVILIFMTNVTKWFFLNHEENVLQKQIASIYMQIFPEATSVINPRARIEQLVSKSYEAQQGSDFFNILGIVGQVIQNTPQIKLHTISYSNNQLIIDVEVVNANVLQQFNDQLGKYPINIKQGETLSSGTTITSKFYLTRKST